MEAGNGYHRADAREGKAAPPGGRRTLLHLPLTAIHANPYQPRKRFDEAAQQELMRSIAESGLIQPLVVRAHAGRYELIAGERRLRALRALGYAEAPCVVQTDVGESDSALMALIVNVQRRGLHFFEEAECYRALIKTYGMTQEQLARRLGKSQSFLANKLRILHLSPALRKKLCEAGLSERHARALLSLPDERVREEALIKIAERALNVKETERLVERLLTPPEPAEKPKRVRLLRDYRLFVNSVRQGAAQLTDAGFAVELVQTDVGEGVDVLVRVRKREEPRVLSLFRCERDAP